jgi:CBS domain-containing protein
MRPSDLSQPIGAFLRVVEPLAAEDSLHRAAGLLRESGAQLLPVARGGAMIGALSQRSLTRALADGLSTHDPVALAIEQPDTISICATGAEALRRFHDSGTTALVVVDPVGRVYGIVSPSDLIPSSAPGPRPHLVGGMATPFGVYLTTGGLGAGAGPLALVSTGALMFAIIIVGSVLAQLLYHPALPTLFWELFPILFFLLALRALPLSKIHAAEHKVVHALERGEPLTHDVVERMPRVHPRCGTNIAVGAAIFLSIASSPLIGSEELRLLLAVIVTLFVWRPVGNAVQWLVTTSPPKRKHIASGIRAAEELVEKYRISRGRRPNIGQRILNSGILHVMTGSLLCYTVARLISLAIGFDLVL